MFLVKNSVDHKVYNRVCFHKMSKKTNSDSIHDAYNKSCQLKTSAEIIKEARMSLNMNAGRGAKMVAATRRPETPAYPPRSLLFRRLRLNVGRTGSATSYCSEFSVESEPPSRFQKLEPLPQRPHSASASIEKSSLRIRRRPLSVITTSVTCDTALHQLQKEKRKSQEAPNQNDSYLKAQLDTVSVSGSLSSLPLSNGSESGYFSRLSSANIEEDLASVTSDELADSKNISPKHAELLQTCLNKLNPLARNNTVSEEELGNWVDKLKSLMTQEPKLSKRGQLRTIILQTLFRGLDESMPQLCSKIIPLILSMNVTGQNLYKVSRLIFELTSNKDNDTYFDNEWFINSFVSMLKKQTQFDGSTLLYMTGSLDSLSSNASIRRRLIESQAVSLINDYISVLMSREHLLPPDDTPRSEVLTQLLSTVRNLLDSGRQVRQKLLEVELLKNILVSMDFYSTDAELILQGARIMSKISLHEDCCEQLIAQEPDIFKCAARWLKIHNGNRDVTVRLLFVLGNLLSTSDKAQWHLFQAQGFIQTLVKTFEMYLEEHRKTMKEMENSDDNIKNELVDLLVKLIRVVANLSVHQAVGSMLCLNEDLILCHIQVLETFLTSEKEELVLNTLVSLHNLSFYQVEDSGIRKHQLEFVKALYPILISDKYNPRKVVESFNVLGNLTQHQEVCKWLFDHKVHTMMIALLDGNSTEVACSACGILINLSLQVDNIGSTFCQDLGKKASHVLQKYKNKNWYFCGLICKLLCNVLVVNENLNYLSAESIDSLINELLEATDESTEKFPHGLPQELHSQLQDLWETEFCPVATKLLEIISNNNSIE